MILGGDSYRVLREITGDGGGTGSLDVETPQVNPRGGVAGAAEYDTDDSRSMGGKLLNALGKLTPEQQKIAEKNIGTSKPKVAPPEGLSGDEQEALRLEQAKNEILEARSLFPDFDK